MNTRYATRIANGLIDARGERSHGNENYTIEDYLQGLNVTLGSSKVVGPDAAIPRFSQQLSLVKSIGERFRSSLFDIRQLAQADLFDSELDAAKELAKNKFTRRAAASKRYASLVECKDANYSTAQWPFSSPERILGQSWSRHLKEVCGNHGVTVRKAKPTISDLNDALKNANAIEIPQWRSIQFLGDLRNLCDHANEPEPTADQVEDLLAGVAKVTKTIF